MKAAVATLACLLILLSSAVAQSGPHHENAATRTGLVLTLVPFPRVERAPLPPLLLVERASQAVGQSCVGTTQGPEVLGDLVLMRKLSDINISDPAIGRALAAAYISQNATVADRLLAVARGSADPAIAFISTLVTLHVALRAGVSVPTDELKRLERLGQKVSFSTADVDYFLGLAYLHEGRFSDASQAADRAIEKEPTFFNAHMLRLGIMLRRFSQTGIRDATCVPRLVRLGTILRQLTDLAPCPIQAVYVDAFLEAESHLQPHDPAFLLTRAYLAALARNGQAVRALSAGLRDVLSTAPGTEVCNSIIAREVTGLEHIRPGGQP